MKKVWIFRTTKSQFNLREKFNQVKEIDEDWESSQLGKEIKEDDIAIFLQTVDDEIQVVGRITKSIKKSKGTIFIKFDHLIEPPIPISALLENDTLADLFILNQKPSHTPSRVLRNQSRELNRLLGNKWNDDEISDDSDKRKRSKTHREAKPFPGDLDYQKFAELALPILVRQAEVGKTIYYSDLAQEIKMSKSMLKNHIGSVLGSIGRTLQILERQWEHGKIPAIQSVAVTKKDGFPNTGIDGFFFNENESPSDLQRAERIRAEWGRVYSYKLWREVLKRLSLKPAKTDWKKYVKRAKRVKRCVKESDEHKRLKQYIQENPKVIRLKRKLSSKLERKLPSGDRLDVSFIGKKVWVGVEVKSKRSDDNDIARGIYQCVKYQAVMEAEMKAYKNKKEIFTILVTEEKLSGSLIELKNVLNVTVFDGIKVPMTQSIIDLPKQ